MILAKCAHLGISALDFGGIIQNLRHRREPKHSDRPVSGPKENLLGLADVPFEGHGPGDLGVEAVFGRSSSFSRHV